MATASSVLAVIRAARPSFRNAHDGVAFAIHAAFLAAGFSLTATGPQALSDAPPVGGDEVGIEGWNEVKDSYGFLYTKTEKGVKKNVCVKCLAIGDVLMVDAMVLEEQKPPQHLEINVKEFVADGGDQTRNYAEMYRNFEGLVQNLNTHLLAILEPKAESSSSAPSSRPTWSGSEHDTTIPVETQPTHPGYAFPPITPYGGSDLFPGTGAGFYPERGPGIGGIGGGMLVGPNDPRFFGSGPQPGSFGGELGGVPPGARFDPIGPPDVPGFEPGRFVRQPRRPSGRTHPDLEPFQGPDFI